MLEPQGMAAVMDAESEATFGWGQSRMPDHLRGMTDGSRAREPLRTRWSWSGVLRSLSAMLSAVAAFPPTKPEWRSQATESAADSGAMAMTRVQADRGRRCGEQPGSFGPVAPQTNACCNACC